MYLNLVLEKFLDLAFNYLWRDGPGYSTHNKKKSSTYNKFRPNIKILKQKSRSCLSTVVTVTVFALDKRSWTR